MLSYFPTGQATWHIHDTEMTDFEWLPLEANNWDRHTSHEKYNQESFPAHLVSPEENT